MQRTSNPLLGAAFILAGMGIVGLIDNFVKVIAQDAGLWQFHFLRSIIACSIMTAFVLLKGGSLAPVHWCPVILRSVLFSTSMVLYFGSLALMPIAQVGAGLFLSPIFVMIFSALFFKMHIGWVRITAAILGFAGVLIILRPNPDTFSILTILPMIAGAFYAASVLVTRHLCATENTVTLLNAFFFALGIWGLIGLITLSIITPPTFMQDAAPFFTTGWRAPTQLFVIWTVLQAVFSIVAVGFLTRAYQVGEPSFVSIFEYSFLIYAGFWGWMLFGETLDAWSLIGIAIIIVSGTIIAVRTKDI